MGAHRVVRFSLLALVALMLGACAAQPRDQVQVGIGIAALEPAKARDYAALYTPYAMMATAAYTNKEYLTVHRCPDPYQLGRGAAAGESARDVEFRHTVRGWIKELGARGWRCEFGDYGALGCPKRLGPDCKPVGGLEFHVWRRDVGGQCREVAIAFRGTDRNDAGDWASNFRWLNRLAPKFDQYAQVQTHIQRVVRHIRSHGCGGANTQIVSAGHSLGGGLAQQAAYAAGDNGIKYVYTFDSSPVTGFFDVSAMLREQSTRGLGVDRAYEQGEILMLPRLVIENIFPPTPCNPQIRHVRFNLLDGKPVEQHNIENLTRELRTVSRERGADPRRVEASAQARGCTAAPMIAPPA